MKKASKRKSAAKKKAAKPAKKRVAKAKTAKQKPAAPTATASNGVTVTKQPQVKQQAAVAAGMFLYTDDAWSLRYFDPNDLHSKEREVFG
jgi:hypothetical protein